MWRDERHRDAAPLRLGGERALWLYQQRDRPELRLNGQAPISVQFDRGEAATVWAARPRPQGQLQSTRMRRVDVRSRACLHYCRHHCCSATSYWRCSGTQEDAGGSSDSGGRRDSFMNGFIQFQ